MSASSNIPSNDSKPTTIKAKRAASSKPLKTVKSPKSARTTAGDEGQDDVVSMAMSHLSVLAKVPKEPKAPKAPKALKPEPETCDVCCSTFTKVKRKPIECPFCSYAICYSCSETFFLSKADAHCMSCKRVFNKEFLKEHFTKVFVGERLTDHYVDVLLELEKSLLPQTMEAIQKEKKKEQYAFMQSLIVDLTGQNDYVTDINSSFAKGTFPSETPDQNKCIIDVANEWLDDYSRINVFQTNDRSQFYSFRGRKFIDITLRGAMYRRNDKVIGIKDAERLVKRFQDITAGFLQQCFDKCDQLRDEDVGCEQTRCNTDKCPGYLFFHSALTAVHSEGKEEEKAPTATSRYRAGYCNTCKTIQCMDCYVNLGTFTTECTSYEIEKCVHACDPNVVKTLRMIEKTSKPCPVCKERIIKNSGCNQMFCTNCHTAFDWESNQVMTGRVHNPHYFEWLNKLREKGETPPEPNATAPNAPQGGEVTARGPDGDAFERNRPGGCNPDEMLPDWLFREIGRYCWKSNPYFDSIQTLWTTLVHIAHHEIPMLQVNPNPVQRYEHLRCKFLQGQVTEGGWKTALKAAYRAHDRNEGLRHLYDAVVLIGHNLFHQFRDMLKRAVSNVSSDVIGSHHRNAELKEPLLPVYKTMLLEGMEMAEYFNKYSKAYSKELGHKQYNKLFMPHPQLVESIETRVEPSRDDARAMYFQFGKSDDMSDNELPFMVRGYDTNLVKHLELIDAEREYLVFCQPIIQRVMFIEEALNDLTKEYTLPTLQRLSKLFQELLTTPEVHQYANKFESILQPLYKTRSRTQIVMLMFKYITNLLQFTVQTVMRCMGPYIRERYFWAHHEELGELYKKYFTLRNYRSYFRQHYANCRMMQCNTLQLTVTPDVLWNELYTNPVSPNPSGYMKTRRRYEDYMSHLMDSWAPVLSTTDFVRLREDHLAFVSKEIARIRQQFVDQPKLHEYPDYSHSSDHITRTWFRPSYQSRQEEDTPDNTSFELASSQANEGEEEEQEEEKECVDEVEKDGDEAIDGTADAIDEATKAALGKWFDQERLSRIEEFNTFAFENTVLKAANEEHKELIQTISESKYHRSNSFAIKFYPRVKGLYYNDHNARFVCEPSYGFHDTRKIGEFTVVYPRWLSFLFTTDPIDLITNKRVKMQRNQRGYTAFCSDLVMSCWSQVTLNGVTVGVLEASLLSFASLQRGWTMEDVEEIECRVHALARSVSLSYSADFVINRGRSKNLWSHVEVPCERFALLMVRKFVELYKTGVIKMPLSGLDNDSFVKGECNTEAEWCQYGEIVLVAGGLKTAPVLADHHAHMLFDYPTTLGLMYRLMSALVKDKVDKVKYPDFTYPAWYSNHKINLMPVRVR